MTDPVAVYAHIPFCPSKCGYCDFNSYAMEGPIVERTVKAIILEMRRSPHRGRPAKTIFFGGGTPTHLRADWLVGILEAVIECHPPLDGCEITSEANPGTVAPAKLKAMRRGGFNRISIGGQSFRNDDLIRLGRVHDAEEIGRAVTSARGAGFDNVNVDLMFALPGQSFTRWMENLDRAIALGTEHLSLYCLTLEPNTKFYKLHLKGLLDLPDDDAQIEMYEAAVEKAEEAGFVQYEISNFCKPGFECRHNLCYWRGEEYTAYGPGAVEQVAGFRWTHVKHPAHYCDAVELGGDLACEREELTPQVRRNEQIMLGLRLNEGLPLDSVKVEPKALACVLDHGWAKTDGCRLRLTQTGRRFCNEAVVALM